MDYICQDEGVGVVEILGDQHGPVGHKLLLEILEWGLD
jgi:hypothetical protein